MHFLVQVSTSLRKGESVWNGVLSERNMRSYCRQSDLLVEHARDHLDLGLCCCDLLCGRRLRTGAAEEERHCEGLVCGCGFWFWWELSGVGVEIIVARRLLLVDGCWSRAQRSLVLERTEGETSNFWKLRPTTTLPDTTSQRELYILQSFARCICSIEYMITIAQRCIRELIHR